MIVSLQNTFFIPFGWEEIMKRSRKTFFVLPGSCEAPWYSDTAKRRLDIWSFTIEGLQWLLCCYRANGRTRSRRREQYVETLTTILLGIFVFMNSLIKSLSTFNWRLFKTRGRNDWGCPFEFSINGFWCVMGETLEISQVWTVACTYQCKLHGLSELWFVALFST